MNSYNWNKINLNFSKNYRLISSEDFAIARKDSSLLKSSFFLFFYTKNNSDNSRLGLKISKKAGNAIQRNRLKRILRENFRKSTIKTHQPGLDIVVAINTRGFNKSIPNELLHEDIKLSFSRLLEKSKP